MKAFFSHHLVLKGMLLPYIVALPDLTVQPLDLSLNFIFAEEGRIFFVGFEKDQRLVPEFLFNETPEPLVRIFLPFVFKMFQDGLLLVTKFVTAIFNAVPFGELIVQKLYPSR